MEGSCDNECYEFDTMKICQCLAGDCDDYGTCCEDLSACEVKGCDVFDEPQDVDVTLVNIELEYIKNYLHADYTEGVSNVNDEYLLFANMGANVIYKWDYDNGTCEPWLDYGKDFYPPAVDGTFWNADNPDVLVVAAFNQYEIQLVDINDPTIVIRRALYNTAGKYFCDVNDTFMLNDGTVYFT
eukprot:UN27915